MLVNHHQLTMKRILPLLLLVALPVFVSARLMQAWTYQEMFDTADLVVIARPIATKVTAETPILPRIPNIKLTGLETEFEVSTVMKGAKKDKFVLHYYRFANPNELLINGPSFLAFIPARQERFLMYLVKERDGRYAPVGGQEDPALISVLKLDGIAK
jgi:hypothetical protein